MKTTVLVSSENLFTTTSVPSKLKAKAAWYVAMIYLGTEMDKGRQLNDALCAEALAHLRELNQHCFNGYVFDKALRGQLDRAIEICRTGKNNLFGSLIANEGNEYELSI